MCCLDEEVEAVRRSEPALNGAFRPTFGGGLEPRFHSDPRRR